MNYTVIKEGEKMDVRTATVYPAPYHANKQMEYVQFTMQNPVVLVIESEQEITSALVRPLSLGIEPILEAGKIMINIQKPAKFSLEINESMENNLVIFAENDCYDNFSIEQKDHFVYFPAGIHDAGIIHISKDNTIVYLEENSYVHGKIDIDGCDNITICGYGTITMEKYPAVMRKTYKTSIHAQNCEQLTIKDITITDSSHWCLRVDNSEHVLIDNVKIIGCRGNTDGVDICGSRHVLVQNVFTRVWDDSLVVKGFDTGDIEDVTFQHCILWNDFARPIEVGVELRADKVTNIKFSDIDIIHSSTGYPLMGIHHGDRAVVSDILFEKIRIEDTPGAQLFDVRVKPSVWNKDSQTGCIKNIIFRNIQVLGKPGFECMLSDSRLQGCSEVHNISGVLFDHINILGKAVLNAEAMGLLCQEYVENVKIRANDHIPQVHMIQSNIEMIQPFSMNQSGYYKGVARVFLKNTEAVSVEKEFRLQISPANMGEYDRGNVKVQIPANDETSIDFPIVLPPGKYMITIQSSDMEVRYAWKLEELDWVLPKNGEFSSAPLPFVNYYGDKLGEVKIAVKDEFLILSSQLLKRSDCIFVIYAAEPVERHAGEVVFSVEETDLGVVPAVVDGSNGLELAPQLRCPLEITMVFRNEPKVKKIYKEEIHGGFYEQIYIPLESLGLTNDTKNFWLEIEAKLPEVAAYRYPYTLFHSVTPMTTVHMYGNVVLSKD